MTRPKPTRQFRRAPGPASGHRFTGWWPVAAVAATAAIVGLTAGTVGGFTASIANAADKVQSASLLTAASSGGTTECDLGTAGYSPITAANTAPCTGSLATGGTAPATGTAALATVVKNEGSLAATAAKVTKATCGPVSLANSVMATDPMLVRGSPVSYAQTGPLTGGTGLGLNSTAGTGYAADVTSAAGPATFTEAVWFKTTTAGTLLGFTDTPATNSPSDWDRMLWVDNSGYVVFGVQSTSKVEVTSTSTYNNGSWHLAVGTLSSSKGMVLYVDGSSVASNASTTSAASYAGFWHAGWDDESSGWSDPPTLPYFAGTLADAAIFPSALSKGQAASLYGSASQSAWNTALTADGASLAWTLGDNGTTAYTGTVPNVTPAACAFVDVTVGATGAATTCAAPAGAGACAAPSGSITLASLGPSTSLAVFPTPAQPVTVTVTIARDATNTIASSPYATGLHLTAPMTMVAFSGAFTATLSWAAENVIL